MTDTPTEPASTAPAPAPATGWSRRHLLVAGGGAALAALVGGGAGYAIARGTDDDAPAEPEAAESPPRFRSRPDLDTVPEITITEPAAAGTAAGYVFLTPGRGAGLYGPMIVDDAGELVWFHRVPDPATVAIDFKVQRYRGRPVLTWWEGTIGGTGGQGVGQGEFVIADESYREITRIRAAGAEQADQHDFVLTDEGTAVFWIYDPIPYDLSPAGGAAGGALFDGLLQEVDVATGRRVFEWRASGHIGLDESYAPLPAGELARLPWDYFHPNSVQLDTDGHLLFSARHTSGCYKVHRRTGEVLWRLGGKRSDFTIGERADFSWQHDFRRRSDGTYSLFDNAAGITEDKEQSRGLVLRLDEQARTATFVREFLHPERLLAPTQANMHELPDGGSFVGWGQMPHFSEHAPDGTVRFAGRLPLDNQSYRAYRAEWTGRPLGQPALGVHAEGGNVLVHVSWNGATEVTGWRARAGDQPGDLPVVAETERTGFETVLTIAGQPQYVTAEALDAGGEVLGAASIVPVRV